MRRMELKVSKRYITSQTGIAKGTLIRYEKGITHPTPDRLVKLAKVLKVDINYLKDTFYTKIKGRSFF